MEVPFSKLIYMPILILACFIFNIEAQQRQQPNGNILNNPYWHREVLDTRGLYYLEWLVDWKQETITFNVTCATRGYVGFGLARESKMEGADIIIGGVSPNGNVYFTDRHAIAEQIPIIDQQQNWVLHAAQENGTHTFLSFSRAFDTCDQNDIPITDDALYLLWAFGDTDNEDVQYHGRNRGSFLAYLRDPDLTPRPIHEINQIARITGQQAPNPARVDGAQVWTVRETFQVPPKRTTYWCNLKRFNPPVPGKKHMIGFNVRMNQEGIEYMHHMLLYRCNIPLNIVKPSVIFEPLANLPGQECYDLAQPLGPIPTVFCNSLKFGHAIGGRPQFFNGNLGIPLGETNDVEYYLLQVHYDNPNNLTNITTDIQLDMYYTQNLRLNDAGIISIGHHIPGSPGILIPPGEQRHLIYGHCSQSCTRRMLPPQGIQLAGGLLHAHLGGRRIRARHYRNGRELPWAENDDNYKFQFQNLRMFREEKTLLPGDQLSIQCQYDSTERNTSIVGGYSTDQEMCMVFFLHYNVLENYPICRSELDSTEYMMRYLAGTNNVTWVNERLENVALSPAQVAGLTMSEISDSGLVNWDSELRRELQRDHILEPQTTVCPSLIEAMKALILGIEPPPQYVNLPIELPEYEQPQRCGLNG